MGLLLEQIELIEGAKEAAQIVKTMRSLGKDVDEIRQYLEKSTGKSLDDLSDQELFSIASKGAAQAQKMAPQADKDPVLQKDFKDAQAAMDIPFFGPGVVADRLQQKLKAKYPSGAVPAISPDGKQIDIDVDISGDDLRAIEKATKRAGKTFPQALDQLRRGNFSSALGRVVDKTLTPTPKSQTTTRTDR
mgnify:CR=1 FL=1